MKNYNNLTLISRSCSPTWFVE